MIYSTVAKSRKLLAATDKEELLSLKQTHVTFDNTLLLVLSLSTIPLIILSDHNCDSFSELTQNHQRASLKSNISTVWHALCSTSLRLGSL